MKKTRDELKAAILGLERVVQDTASDDYECPWCGAEEDRELAEIEHRAGCLWLELKNEP